MRQAGTAPVLGEAIFDIPRPLWESAHADGLSPAEALLYRSNLLGRDLSITNYGGGNTSAKLIETDPLSGEAVEVLWVKGSGGDLGSMHLDGFATLYQSRLLSLKDRYRGIEFEDEMVGYLSHCTFNLNSRAASIDTPLHAFLPFAHVDHVHPDAILAIACAADSRRLTQTIFGGKVGWVGWQRPGFDLGLKLARVAAETPGLRGIVLEGHGLFSWADTSKACYDNTLSLIAQAADYINRLEPHRAPFGSERTPARPEAERRAFFARLNPRLRALMSDSGLKVAEVSMSDAVLEFVGASQLGALAALGTACPDHFLRTKRLPLILPPDVAQDEARLSVALEQYRRAYNAYYNRHADRDSPPMRDPNPVVVLIPGYGMVCFGASKSRARLAAEYYSHAIHVMKGAQALDTYSGLDEAEAFRIEYWALEEAKLKREPKPKPLAGKIALITGGAGGIGRAIAHRLLKDDACVVLTDIDTDRLESARLELCRAFDTDRVRAVCADATDEPAVRAAFDQAQFDYGGVDILINNAGFASAAAFEDTTLSMWEDNFGTLAQGYFLSAREAFKGMKALGGAMVFIVSKNALSPSAGSAAYNAAKAAQVHLARCLAVEGAPHGIRVNVINPDAVLRDSHIWTGDWRTQRAAAYHLEAHDLEDYYRQRSLLKRSVFPEDVAEAAAFLVSEAASKSTGNILNVDAGHAAAFPR